MPRDERCNRCGGELRPAAGVVPVLECAACGRQVPAAAFDVTQPLTPDEVAELVRVSRKTVMRAIASGELEASQLTQKRGGWRVWPSAVDEWMRARSNRVRGPRPLANIRAVDTHAAHAADRARRQGAGHLRVTREMGRVA